MMENYSISYNDLMDFPFEKYIEFSIIISEENKEERKRKEKQEREMEEKM